jgi:hypothetical protein
MNTHQKKVLKFHLSYEAGKMTKKQADERISEMREEAWKEHLKMQRPDGTCRAGCPLHAKK